MVSNQTLSVDIWNSVRTILVAAALQVTDGSTVSDATIAAAYNDKKTSKPQVIIYPIEKDEASFKFGSNEGKKFINMNILCYAKNTRQADELKDQVVYTIKRTDFDGMDIVAVTTDHAFNSSNDNKYELTSVNFTFDRE